MSPPPDEPPSRGLDPALAAASPTERVSPDEVPTAVLPAGETASIFLPNELIASRYRVVRFIARGGMGEVYEVEDLDLAVRVALKTVRPEPDGGSHAAERFKREIQLARQVTHPNVCRIFDLVRHTRASGRGAGTRSALPDDGAPVGRNPPGPSAAGRNPEHGAGAADRGAARLGPRRRPQGRRGPWRLQERERDARAHGGGWRRAGRDHGLRARPRLRGIRLGRRHGDAPDHRYARVHVARADGRQARDGVRRHLRAGHRHVRARHRPATVRGRRLAGGGGEAPDRAAPVAAIVQARPRPEVGGGHPDLPAARSRPALRHG